MLKRMNYDKLCCHIHTCICHSPFPKVSKEQKVPQQLHHALWCLEEKKLTLTITPNHPHNAWICGPMLAIVGVLQVVETQHICLIEPIFWMRVFLYLPKKNMKNGMILPFVTSNMLTRKRPFPREGSLSLVKKRQSKIWGAGPRKCRYFLPMLPRKNYA